MIICCLFDKYQNIDVRFIQTMSPAGVSRICRPTRSVAARSHREGRLVGVSGGGPGLRADGRGASPSQVRVQASGVTLASNLRGPGANQGSICLVITIAQSWSNGVGQADSLAPPSNTSMGHRKSAESGSNRSSSPAFHWAQGTVPGSGYCSRASSRAMAMRVFPSSRVASRRIRLRGSKGARGSLRSSTPRSPASRLLKSWRVARHKSSEVTPASNPTNALNQGILKTTLRTSLGLF